MRDYDPTWLDRFEERRAEFAVALGVASVAFVSIEHVGSTSVPGLAAKPVIDIDIVVESSNVNVASSVLVGLGFEPRGELGIPQRWAFWEPERIVGTNAYVVVVDSLALRNHLDVRDTLRADRDLCAEYGKVKKRVGAAAADIYEYGAGKNEVIQCILAAAGLSDQDRASINTNQVPVTERKR